MTPLENLIDALAFSKIEVLSINGNHIKVQNNFEIEVEANGIYKLLDDGYIVAPFNDLDKLCRFILN